MIRQRQLYNELEKNQHISEKKFVGKDADDHGDDDKNEEDEYETN